mgnify:CR=1 FL=1
MSLMRSSFTLFLFVFLVILLNSCDHQEQPDSRYQKTNEQDVEVAGFERIQPVYDTILAQQLKISKLEKKMIDSGLVNILDVDSTIQVDVKYTTTDNFVGIDLYGDLNKIYFQPEIAQRLKKVQAAIKEVDSSLSLLIYDGTRPVSVQRKMWNALDTIPVNERVKFVSNPKNGSIHNYGCAVDLTLMNVDTKDTLDMGAGFDDPRKIAYPKFEKQFLESGELTHKQFNNRLLLREAMRKGGFWVLPTEWWHFNGYSRMDAKEKFSPIE